MKKRSVQTWAWEFLPRKAEGSPARAGRGELFPLEQAEPCPDSLKQKVTPHRNCSPSTNQTPQMPTTTNPTWELEIPCIESQSGSARSAGVSQADDAILRAFAAVRSWRTPPNWSLRDWHNEARAIIAAAGCRADLDYDAKRGVPRTAFIYRRAVASVWTRYRQEWSYAVRFAAGLQPPCEQPIPAPSVPNHCDPALDRPLCDALSQLPSVDRWLIRQLFWNRKTEHQLAAALCISQQAISRRKGRVLKQLRRVCNLALLSQFVSVVAACLDSLGLIPATDFWL